MKTMFRIMSSMAIVAIPIGGVLMAEEDGTTWFFSEDDPPPKKHDRYSTVCRIMASSRGR